MAFNTDLAKAKAFRNDAKTIKDPAAKQKVLDAADRLEKRAARSLDKVARRRRKGSRGVVAR